MRISKICAFFAVLALFVSRTSFSQETELSFKQVVGEAFKYNTTVIEAQEEINAQDFNIKASYSDILPSLSFNGGWTRSNNINQGGQTFVGGVTFNDPYSNTTNNNFNLSLRSDITLFNGFSNYDRVKGAKFVRTRLVSLLQKTKAFVEIGTKTMTDIYRQDAVVALNELTVEQAKNTYNKSVADLIFDANMNQTRNYTVSGSEFPIDISNESMESYLERVSNTDFLVNVALKNRYDYKAATQNLDVLRINYDIADNAVLFPTLSGFSSYDLSGNSFGNISNSRVFSIGLSLSYPIFEGFTLDNQRQQTIISLRIANDDLLQVRSLISVDIKKAVLDLRSLVKQVDISDRSLKSTEQDKIAAEEQYKVGLTTLLDVNTAEINYNNALIIKSNLVYDFILAQKQLEYLQGLIQY